MSTKKFVLALGVLFLAFLHAYSQTTCRTDASDLTQYNGRFVFPDGSLLVLGQVDGQLTARPIFWTSLQTLQRKNGDAFGIEGRDDRAVEFVRDGTGCISAVKLAGFGADGTFPKASEEKMPVEFLLAGQPEKAAQMMIAAYPKDAKMAIGLGESVLNKRPSQSADAIRYLNELAKHFPDNSRLYATLAWGNINTDDRKTALANFRKAYKLDANSEEAKAGLRRLGALQPSAAERAAGWQLPFSLDEVFAPPTAAEIKAADADRARRDLTPDDVQEVATGTLDLGQTKATVRIVSHTVHGRKNYGAIVIPVGPAGAETGKHPVLLDLKGVSPDFFPLNLDRLMSPRILGDKQSEFIYVVPSFRGEVMQFKGKEYRSEGDPTDSWDGATDDSLAFLNAALSITPQADRDRISAFGKSRGGALAMLAGIRDSRIKRVVSWSGPTDFFKLMGEGGWWQKEVVSEALLHRAKPEDDGGQFVATFLAKSIAGPVAGKKTLAEVRRLMIQSSALYFAQRLPLTQAYYGVEDGMVNVCNGRALESAARAGGKVKVFYHQAAGHDLNTKLAVPETKKFLTEILK